MAEKRIKLTKLGREKLEKELEELVKVKRPEIIDRIKKAKDYGDLSENAEYEEARNEQSFIEGRVQEIEYMLKSAEIAENTKGGVVGVGSSVKVKMDGEEMTYEIVGSTEADPTEGKISSESPIGSSLVGKKAGDTCSAKTPGGEIELKILAVE
ncbi:MAG: transcription elongation factor GreA [Candidatus Berkelbacteria bacterium]|nr:transcription elongation factor GreA [Candidatus Berkelbacteria bacterium]